MFDHQNVIEEAFELLSGKIVLSEQEDIFKGNVYKDKSKLPSGRLKRNIFDFRKHLTGNIDKLQPLFIIGYNLEESRLFYEIWYLPFEGQYIIIDKFGKRTTKFHKYETITQAVDELVDIISTVDIENFDEDDLEKDIERNAERNIRSKYKTTSRTLDRDEWNDDSGFKRYAECETQEDIDTLLEQNITSRGLLADMINSNITEYRETRMNRSKINSLWKFLLGRDIEYPTKYLGGGVKGAVLKLLGREKEASFVVGYSLGGKLDFEIWFVKSVTKGKGSFYVFDITAAKVLAKDLPNMRQAYAYIANKITTKV